MSLYLRFTQRNGRTILAERRVLYPYAITAPINRAGTAELTLQSISGGIYGGDSLSQSIEVSENTSAKLIQPAATTVRRNNARQNIRLITGKNANLLYLTRPLIMFPGSAFIQNWAIIIAPGARLIFFDGFLAHTPNSNWSFTSHLTAHTADGKLLATERMETHGHNLAAYKAFGKFWCFGQSMSALPEMSETQTGISALPNNAGFTIALAAQTGGALCAAMEQITQSLALKPLGAR